jgi:hypothetical protein
VAGAATAAAAAGLVHAVVAPGCDLVLAMLIGMAAGMLAHLAVLALASPLLGFFQVMAPGAIIGMLGGTLFAMRDAMQTASWSRALAVAALFGVLVVAAVNVYDRVLRSSAATRREEEDGEHDRAR